MYIYILFASPEALAAQSFLQTWPYLIFVISFTPAGFWNPNILYPKITKNTQNAQQTAQKSATYAVLRV